MRMVKVKAYAKLNFTLDITGVSAGYHMLDSLVCTVDLYDLITLKKRRDNLVGVEMHGQGTETLPFEINVAAKAAQAYIKKFGTCGADIIIYKNIPVGGGLGGSSADASGVLNGMARLYGAGGESGLKAIADGLGSDTGYLLTGGWARLNGRGERVIPLDISRTFHALLLIPQGGVSTPSCYKKYDETPVITNNTQTALNALSAGDTAAFGMSIGNALYGAANALNPAVMVAYEELSSFAPSGVTMTGSGSGVFALFETAELRDWAYSRYRGKFRAIKLKTVNKIKR